MRLAPATTSRRPRFSIAFGISRRSFVGRSSTRLRRRFRPAHRRHDAGTLLMLASLAERNGARRGADVLRRLRERPPALWYRGERVADVTTHAAFRGGVTTLAELYDLQWRRADECLFESPASGRQVARSFQLPRTAAQLGEIGRAMAIVARHTHGMMGRVPDYLNRALSAYAAGAEFFAAGEPRFGANAVRLHEELREADLCLKIGRASCRERVWIQVGASAPRKKTPPLSNRPADSRRTKPTRSLARRAPLRP